MSINTSENAFDVDGSCTLVCPFDEPVKGTLFSMNGHVRKALMSNVLMGQISEGTGRTVPNHRISNMIESIVKYVSERKALPQDSQGMCIEAINSKQITGKHNYIQMLAHNCIV